MSAIHMCKTCGQQNRVPDQYTGIPVCARCKTQIFPTVMRPATSSQTQKRSRWSKRDWHLVIPILLLALPIHWLITNWAALWAQVLDWLALVTVNLAVITALAISWLVIVLALKVSWEEIWEARQNRKNHPPEDEEPLLDIGPWEVASDFIDAIRYRFALRKEKTP